MSIIGYHSTSEKEMNLKKLIDEDRFGGVFRVHRSAFTSAEISDLEQANIFQRCWLYLGHESELPNSGDFRRRTVAGQPLFWVRRQRRSRSGIL
jgi:p-cumate 2,3-dioxygenase alpha subunit